MSDSLTFSLFSFLHKERTQVQWLDQLNAPSALPKIKNVPLQSISNIWRLSSSDLEPVVQVDEASGKWPKITVITDIETTPIWDNSFVQQILIKKISCSRVNAKSEIQ